MSLWSRRLTDEEFVERHRTYLLTLDRHRPWIILFWAGLAMGLVTFAVWGWDVAMKLAALGNFGQPANGGAVGFGVLAGVGIGITLGGSAIEITHHLLNALFGARSERLMVRYYDLLRAQGSSRRTVDVLRGTICPRTRMKRF